MSEFTSRYTTGHALEHAYHWERTRADRTWLVQPNAGRVRTYTWHEGMVEVRRMAAYLRSLELPPASHIGLLSKNCAHWILCDLAIWMSGHVTVPLYPTSSAESVRQILEHSEAKLAFVGKLDAWSTMKDGVPSGLPIIALPLAPAIYAPRWEDVIAAHAPIIGTPVRRADDLATIVYTSGSTGTPKGVMHTFAPITRAALGVDARFAVQPGERMLSHLPLAHVAERLVVECGTLYAGVEVYFVDALETFAADLRRARPTLFFTVPRLWQKFQVGVFSKLPPAKLERLLRIPVVSWLVRRKILRALGLDHVKLAVGGSAPMPAELLAWYRRLGLELLEGYGMSENFGYSHGNELGQVRPGYVGTPHVGVESRIADDGEIQVKSPGSMIGYFKDPELTAGAFTADGFLKTGDRGEVDARGRLKITGRLKELFKTSKGKYVAPAPIENRFAHHPFVEAVCVSGPSRPQPYALVMLGADARKLADGDGRPVVEASLGEHLCAINAELDPHEALAFIAVVKDVWLIENGFLTPTMKIKRSAIELAYESELDRWYTADQQIVWQ